MDSALLVHRLHFAFTVTFHYLFPQLTMGLAPLIVVLKTLGLRRNDRVRLIDALIPPAPRALLSASPGKHGQPLMVVAHREHRMAAKGTLAADFLYYKNLQNELSQLEDYLVEEVKTEAQHQMVLDGIRRNK